MGKLIRACAFWAAAIGAVVFAAAAPASAERIRTYWRLEPVDSSPPSKVTLGAPFFEQRLLPVRLVALTEPLAAGTRTLAEGTLLYLVFNDDRKIGYCTLKDRSTGNRAKSLFIPILDQRPCFVDSDGDGRFDKVFSVFDKYGGPPSARGSINAAQPMPTAGGYRQVDVHLFPSRLTVAFHLVGKREPAKMRLGIDFSRGLGARWPGSKGVPSGKGWLFGMMNVEVELLSVEGETANINLRWADDMYLSTDNQNTLYWSRLPSFLTGDKGPI